MSRKSLGELLADQARYNPRGISITYGQRKISWGELNMRVNRLATGLKGLGIRKGDHVTIMFHDCPEFIESNYALQKIGAVPVPMNFRFVAREIEYQANQSDSVMFIFEDMFLDEVLKARPALKKVKYFVCLSRDNAVSADGMVDYEGLVADNTGKEPEPCTMESDVCIICYTGGTTGMPKGVVLTYANFWNMAEAVFGDLLARLAMDSNSNLGKIISRLIPMPGVEGFINRIVRYDRARTLVAGLLKLSLSRIIGSPVGPILNRLNGGISMFLNMPLFHMANYQVLITGPMLGLASFILRPGIRFDPSEVLEIIERERPIMLMLVPTQWKRILDYPGLSKYDTSSVLLAMTGAGLNPAERKRRILEEFPNAVVVDVFGQTEMTPNTTVRIDSTPTSIKDRSVGKPLSSIGMRIVGPDGKDVPRGEIGEVLYKSATVMKEYYKDLQKTGEVMKGGWFHSGDLGYLDEDGELIVVDRKEETISTGGEKVYPHEVEEILEAHPKIRYACVIGVPDEEWGQAVRAVIELEDGENATGEEIKEWLDDKLTGFKRPKSIVFADKLPLSPVGKILRKKVKEMFG